MLRNKVIPRISDSVILNMSAHLGPAPKFRLTWFQVDARHLSCFPGSLCGFSVQPSLRTVASHDWALLFSKTQSWDIKYYRKKETHQTVPLSSMFVLHEMSVLGYWGYQFSLRPAVELIPSSWFVGHLILLFYPWSHQQQQL